MRFLAILLCLLASGTTAAFAYRDMTMGPPVVLAPASSVSMSAARTSILPNGWTNASTLTVTGKGRAGKDPGLDVEVRPLGTPFTGTPTASSASTSVTLHLANGRYHWRARLHNGHGVSPWSSGVREVSVDRTRPQVSNLTSPTDPTPGTLYHSSTVKYQWQGSDTGSGIAGYSYRLDSDPHGAALPEIRTAQPSVTLTGLDSGQWYFHVRAQDGAGNWGPSRTFPIHIDVTPPGLANVRFSLYQFDPQFEPLSVSFTVTRLATSVHVGVYRQTDNALVRMYTYKNVGKNQSLTVTWNGKDDHGNDVASGNYSIYVRATDQYGHSSLSGWHDFSVDYKRIVVSLSQQRLWAYDGSKLFLTNLVTTGNRALPTPIGTYHVLGKFHPFTFISPWPKSSPYYYAPSKVQWALLFRSGGYFIHDAPWRGVFGPGSNASVGTPGQNYTGTHGCVNAPTPMMQRLYAWADVGTIVQVVK
jgi:lipoprotein-anchoring transpeptidase ErfK/SrfK